MQLLPPLSLTQWLRVRMLGSGYKGPVLESGYGTEVVMFSPKISLILGK